MYQVHASICPEKRMIGRTPPVPFCPLPKQVLLAFALSCPLMSCGDGGTDPGDPIDDTDFRIELVYISNGTPSQDASFVAAANRWMSLLQDGLDDVDFSSNPVEANTCIQGQPVVSGTVDDLRIYVDFGPIDGTLGTLAQAGPCQIRTTSQLPVLGFLQLDAADVTRLEQDGDLDDVVLHEMGHVLGIGTLWSNFPNLLVNPSVPSNPGADTHFAGAAAIAAFNAAGGSGYTGGAKVPVANEASVGSSDAHWREPVLLLELMTPELSPGVDNPLSAITTESLIDLGYSVDSSGADPFTSTFPTPARAKMVGRRIINLRNDVYRGPIEVVDPNGNVIRTIFPR